MDMCTSKWDCQQVVTMSQPNWLVVWILPTDSWGCRPRVYHGQRGNSYFHQSLIMALSKYRGFPPQFVFLMLMLEHDDEPRFLLGNPYRSVNGGVVY